ncbi:MAG: type II toxin-antitoxin system RelE/ParE family toxin [Acidobacteriota bacterium]|nr:type II toxin-antitoxin system RelE/ParE family toxin [Acidobacteriota bacterium]
MPGESWLNVVWTATAWRDLEQAADYIAQDSPAYAASFVGSVRDRARSLDELCFRGRVVPGLAEPTVRELLLGSHRLVYEISGGTVYVLALIHGARDFARQWRRDEHHG